MIVKEHLNYYPRALNVSSLVIIFSDSPTQIPTQTPTSTPTQIPSEIPTMTPTGISVAWCHECNRDYFSYFHAINSEAK